MLSKVSYLIGLLCLTCLPCLKGQSISRTITMAGKQLDYRVTLPSQYNAEVDYPLLLVPGYEREGDDYSLYLGNDPTQFDWIIVESIVNIKPEFFRALISQLKADYKVRSVFVSGFSANSVPMFSAIARAPGLLQGVIGMPGYANDFDEKVLEQNPEMKVMLIVGEDDGYWKRMAIAANRNLKAYGFDVSLHVIPNQGHIIKALAGRPFFDLLQKLK